MDDFSPKDALRRYRQLVDERPHLFRQPASGGIVIATEAEEIAEICRRTGDERRQVGLENDDVRAGVLAQDPYLTMVRDAVRFPDGGVGLYNRIVEPPCVAVMPVIGGCAVIIEIYRHALREWMWEFPRGGVAPGEDHAQAAVRELEEEITAEVDEVVSLGHFTPGGSSIATRSHLFLAQLRSFGAVQRTEAIRAAKAVEFSEFDDMVAAGTIFDGFTMATYLRARVAGHVG